MFLLGLSTEARAEAPSLTIPFNDSNLIDSDATYGVDGSMHACALGGGGTLRYYRIGADGAVAETTTAMTGAEVGCAVSTRTFSGTERVVLATWRDRAAGGCEVVTTRFDGSAWTSPALTYLFTATACSDDSLRPPALARYIGDASPVTANQTLFVAAAIDASVIVNSMNPPSTSWSSANRHWLTPPSSDLVRDLALAVDRSGSDDRLHVAIAYENTPEVLIDYQRRVDLGAFSNPYGTQLGGIDTEPSTYPGAYPSSISMAILNGRAAIGYTRANRSVIAGSRIAIAQPDNVNWAVRYADLEVSGESRGIHPRLAIRDGNLTATWIDPSNEQLQTAILNESAAGCAYPGASYTCWTRRAKAILAPASGTTLTTSRFGFAAPSATNEAAVLIPQSHIGGSSRPLLIPVRFNQLSCGNQWTTGGVTYSAPKIVGDGTEWYAVMTREQSGFTKKLIGRKWDPTSLSGDVWGSERDLFASDAIGAFDATWSGNAVHIAFMQTSVGARWMEWDGASINLTPTTIDASATTSASIRIASFGERLSVAYPVATYLAYKERSTSGTWTARVTALSGTPSIASVALAVSPDGLKRRVAALVGQTLKTGVCSTSGVCDGTSAGFAPTSLGAPAGTGGAWISDRFDVAYGPDSTRVGIVGGGTGTGYSGKSWLFLHEDTGSGFGATATAIDTAIVGGVRTNAGHGAGLTYNREGEYRAVHLDLDNIAYRTVREFEAVTASPSIVAGTSGVSLGDSIRLGEDRSGDGFLILGTAWSGSGRAGLVCEPPAL